VWDMAEFDGATHVSDAERRSFDDLLGAGLTEVTRQFTPGPGVYTFWDYQKLRFPKKQGMRIDSQLASEARAKTAASGGMDREARKGKGASDHAPVIVDYAPGTPPVRPAPRRPSATSALQAWTSPRSSGEVESGARKVTRMSATARELVDEAYDRRESTWRAALETVNDWVESVRTPSPLLSGDRVRVVEGRIKDRMRTGEKLRRKLADSNHEIHE